jgi:hypothetical protein
LRILPEYGGKTRTRVWRGKRYGSGGPEFLAETCVSSYDYDLHEKLDLYERAQVNEYLAVLVGPHEVWWHRLVKGTLQGVSPSKDGIYRSLVFPGLWLNPDALLACDHAKVLATLQQGLRSAEHAKFVAALAKKKSK